MSLGQSGCAGGFIPLPAVIVQAVAEPPMYFFHKGRYGERPYRLFSRQIIKGKSRFLSCSRRGTKSKVASWLSSIAESPCSRFLYRC